MIIDERKEIQRKLENDMRNLELNEKRSHELMYDYDYKIMQLTKELNQTREELSQTKGIMKNATTTQRDYRSQNNFSRLDDFNPKSADNSNININNNDNNLNNTNIDYGSKLNNFNSFNNYSNRIDRIDSYPSQDYGNTINKTNNYKNNSNNNNEYQYVPSSGI